MYHITGNKTKLFTDFDIGVDGIPYDLKFMYTTYNQSFQILCSIGLMMVKITET